MIIKPPKPGLGFGFWDFGIWFGLAWLGCGIELGVAISATGRYLCLVRALKKNGWRHHSSAEFGGMGEGSPCQPQYQDYNSAKQPSFLVFDIKEI